MRHPIVVGITGASGAVYAQRLLEFLTGQDAAQVHLTISESGQKVLAHEVNADVDLKNFDLKKLLPHVAKRDAAKVTYHHYKDFMTPIASGSFQTSAMIVCPCSGTTMSGIANASSSNLILRAADVHLKEKRRLIVVPRETPLSVLQIRNMEAIASAGATVMPASPGFYHGYDSVNQLVDFVVARILDHLEINHDLIKRWGNESNADPGTGNME